MDFSRFLSLKFKLETQFHQFSKLFWWLMTRNLLLQQPRVHHLQKCDKIWIYNEWKHHFQTETKPLRKRLQHKQSKPSIMKEIKLCQRSLKPFFYEWQLSTIWNTWPTVDHMISHYNIQPSFQNMQIKEDKTNVQSVTHSSQWIKEAQNVRSL